MESPYCPKVSTASAASTVTTISNATINTTPSPPAKNEQPKDAQPKDASISAPISLDTSADIYLDNIYKNLYYLKNELRIRNCKIRLAEIQILQLRHENVYLTNNNKITSILDKQILDETLAQNKYKVEFYKSIIYFILCSIVCFGIIIVFQK